MKEHSCITGLSAFTDMKEPEELQTSREQILELLSNGEAITASGTQRATKRTSNTMITPLFI